MGIIMKNGIAYGAQNTSTQNFIAEREDTSTATVAHSIGDLFINDNKLLKATAAIAIGDTISNLNTTETTIDAEIQNINTAFVPMTLQEYNNLQVKDKPIYFIYEL